MRSIKGRGAVSLNYGFVLLYYTFLCRVRLTVDVAASDYGHTGAVTLTTGETLVTGTVKKTLQMLQTHCTPLKELDLVSSLMMFSPLRDTRKDLDRI